MTETPVTFVVIAVSFCWDDLFPEQDYVTAERFSAV